MNIEQALVGAQVFFIGYFVLLNGGYLMLNLLSMFSLRSYMRQRAEYGTDAPYLGMEPPISLLVPGYNEEATIRTSVRSMLQLQYPDFEVVVINDGSKDRTLEVLIEEFELVPHPEVVRRAVPHKPIRGVYRSLRYGNLRVVDKENGGKADALNVGINLARNGLFCAVDADSILQRDSLLRVVQPFIEDERTVAAGGTVRIANGSEVCGGFLVKSGLPGNLIALDSRNGRLLWRYQMGAPLHGTSVITYMVDGKQYLAIMVGPGGIPLDFHHYAALGTDEKADTFLNFQKSSTLYVFTL